MLYIDVEIRFFMPMLSNTNVLVWVVQKLGKLDVVHRLATHPSRRSVF